MQREDIQYRLLRLLQDNPQLTQRDLAAELGVSVGSTHYSLKALIDKGWVKANNFAQSGQKQRYLYQLTPTGITRKARLTREFLQRKRAEHEAIRQEIEALEAELNAEPDADK
ncbi:MarR family EPS-associated transcriptional regulator [Ectothiorhodospira marina]|uniref:EPS-associated transcriptional regulator, MarR family n=1 Tax=Ectothiorhodospira marina TaxID=1396821 RepID=A0A1H7M333_9GAMM|nr:MarR family EPS-associated transcriptional regulator [Ectothiorhodospira marina]SEL05499.1 EPS-associated transcriptional regulator, MarR family [Ectothiorhodospira marina]